MKTSKIIFGIMTLVAVFAIYGSVNTVPAQEKLKVCKPAADQTYFVDSGQSVTEVHPGSNGGNGYQLNIIGTDVDKFQLVQESYMTTISLISASNTQAKWQVFFAPNMGRTVSVVRMKAPDCTGRVIKDYRLTGSVRLLDQ